MNNIIRKAALVALILLLFTIAAIIDYNRFFPEKEIEPLYI